MLYAKLISYRASSARDSLDANTVRRVADGAVRDVDARDGIIRASTYRSNADTVATRASSTGKFNVCARVNCKAVILVLDIGAGDFHIGRGTDVKGVGVVAAIGDITGRVVDGDIRDGEVGSRVD
jgi:hypothetical protein